MIKIKTSSGHMEEWDKKKIINQIIKDYDHYKIFSINGIEIENIEEYAKNVAERVERGIRDNGEDEINTYEIRGQVIKRLYKDGYGDLARASTEDGISPAEFEDIRLGKEDYDNANLTPSPETVHKLFADKISKVHYLKVLPKHLSDAHITGDLHIHDLEYFGTRPFCKSYDLRYTFYYGFQPDGGRGNAVVAGPAQHAEVAILQACKVLGMGQTQHAGGQGLLHGTIFLAPYMAGKSYEEIHQLMQMMVYELNQMYVSRGGQPCFSSINLSPGVPKILEDAPVVYKGKVWKNQKYGDYEREVRLMFKALMELSLEGDFMGRMFPFPKLEVAIERKFIDPNIWDIGYNGIGTPIRESDYQGQGRKAMIIPSYKGLYELAFKVVAKYGTLYFDNLLPMKEKADTTMACTQCCAYRFQDNTEMDIDFNDRINFANGKHFDLGGMQAVSINLPRAAYRANHDDKKLIINIYDTMDKAVEIFLAKYAMINETAHRLQFLTQTPLDSTTKVPGDQFVRFENLVYEIGIVGLNEMTQYHTGKQLHESKEAMRIAKRILAQMSEYCSILSEMTGMKIVLARTPAETVAQKFAVDDMLSDEFSEMAASDGLIKGDYVSAIKNAETTRNLPIFYSNGFAPSVDADIDILSRIALESELWPYVNGGAITHIWLGEEDPDPNGLMDFAMRIFETTNIGYLALTRDLSQCSNCKRMMSGIKAVCEVCGGKEITIYSRITGYYSVVGQIKDGLIDYKWNKGKAMEFGMRKREKI